MGENAGHFDNLLNIGAILLAVRVVTKFLKVSSDSACVLLTQDTSFSRCCAEIRRRRCAFRGTRCRLPQHTRTRCDAHPRLCSRRLPTLASSLRRSRPQRRGPTVGHPQLLVVGSSRTSRKLRARFIHEVANLGNLGGDSGVLGHGGDVLRSLESERQGFLDLLGNEL